MVNPTTTQDVPEVFATEEAMIEVADDHGQAGTHVEPELLGLAPFQWVSIAMAVLLLFAFLGAKVHRTIAGGLDNKIAAIKANLEEAKQLRAEAEALREEYAAKIAGAEKDAEAMIENARREADGIVARAEEDTAAMVARRERMAQDKIASAERQALADLRARAADASTAAAAQLIGQNHDAAADKVLADEMIAKL
ncbi:F0F1 ATP synthase subunit B family protein [Aurantiacibacter hainanensis]|uniref:F0F1 ATP synthase subunit B family protein n=1 Tax=Aurantiacibacter hainanensis TaxID=3076114 RepID=UPI003EBA33CC